MEPNLRTSLQSILDDIPTGKLFADMVDPQWATRMTPAERSASIARARKFIAHYQRTGDSAFEVVERKGLELLQAAE